MFAHVTAGVVDSVGNPPQLVFYNGRWWDLRNRDLNVLATVGWYPVTEATKPADTVTTTWNPVFTLNGAVIIQSWTEVQKTPEQITAEAEAAAQDTIEVALGASLAGLQAVIDQTNADLRADPSQEIKDIARAVRRTIRLLIRRFDGTT